MCLINVAGKLCVHMQKIEIDRSHTSYPKINSKCVKDPNVQPETVNLQQENIGESSFTLLFAAVFWMQSSKHRH